jgi:hypothetical protein
MSETLAIAIVKMLVELKTENLALWMIADRLHMVPTSRQAPEMADARKLTSEKLSALLGAFSRIQSPSRESEIADLLESLGGLRIK